MRESPHPSSSAEGVEELAKDEPKNGSWVAELEAAKAALAAALRSDDHGGQENGGSSNNNSNNSSANGGMDPCERRRGRSGSGSGAEGLLSPL
jgi:hypothetical protein